MEIIEGRSKTNINIRFNKRDIISIKLWIEEKFEKEYKIILGKDFLNAVKPYSYKETE